ncbi:hypothetical protein L3X38_044083 [Prunus dulcis]|uniref:Protein kinase domain-containing protein n=1 Tax=Prunus dulcis TaxID=3755 RepID=A0AAD4UZP0_PRUDU|nr:hypothetical protein L3X38_044083 [Prunus dulcis]
MLESTIILANFQPASSNHVDMELKLNMQYLEVGCPYYYHGKLDCVLQSSLLVHLYLHTAFPRPIVHRNLTPCCIFFDNDDFVPKLSNYLFSITIPPKQLHVEDILIGTSGKFEDITAAPKFHVSDGNIQLQTIVDPKILEEVGGNEQAVEQLQDFLAPALSCVQTESEARPYMIDVAKELVRIEKSILP